MIIENIFNGAKLGLIITQVKTNALELNKITVQ